jgi:hypothetical protein
VSLLCAGRDGALHKVALALSGSGETLAAAKGAETYGGSRAAVAVGACRLSWRAGRSGTLRRWRAAPP